jgi:hypothetical protein
MRKRSQRDQASADTNYRSLAVRAATFSEENRSVEAVISTDQPVLMPDWNRGEMVPEVLVPSGAEYPSNRQVPFLDSHQRRSVKDQLGSAREITISGAEISARLVFRKSAESDDALGGVRDGHITDVSVGYDVLKRQYIPKGDKKTIGTRTYKGPVNVVTKWKVREVSLTPIGADDQAKLRGLDPAAVRFKSSNEQEDFTMNAELRALLVSKGMPEAHTDEQAQRWLIDNAAKLGEVKKEEKKEERSQQTNTLPSAEDLAKLVADATREAISVQEASRKAFESEVRELCSMADVPNEVEACRAMGDIAAVRKHIKEVKAKNAEHIPYGASVRHVSNGSDVMREDIKQTMTLHAVRAAVDYNEDKVEKHFPTASRSKTMGHFRSAGLFDLASDWVASMGINVRELTREQIAICAMFGPDRTPGMGFRAGPGSAAYHSTGSFSSVTLDAVNKSMMIGYGEVPATWRGPMTQGQSTDTFDNIHRVQLGAIPNLPVWNDSVRPDMASMADSRETYAVECRSLGIDFGYKLIMSNNMGALTKTPAKLGDASARTVNAVAWSQVTSNPRMRDGQNLFLASPTGNRKRSNLTTGSVSDYTAALNTMYQKMALMRGENTPEGEEPSDMLNLTPTYVAFPAALRGTLLQLIRSQNDPKATVSGIPNINNDLIPIIEPLLDAASSTAFYTFAGGRVERVEVTFMTGQETPQVRVVQDEHTLATTYYILQSVAAKALDHRGIQKHDGA